MAKPEDVRAKKKVRSELTRRMIDITSMDLQILHKVAYVRGVIRPIKGGAPDVKEEVTMVFRHMKQKGVILDYFIDCIFRTS